MISRRDFLQAGIAAGALAGGIGRLAAQQRLTEAELLRFEPLGTLTILHITDLHAQLLPLHFREPSINLGVGAAKGQPPHLTDAALRAHYQLPAGTPLAHALTSEDFVALARNYGRMGGMDRIAHLINAIRDERGAGNVLLLDGGDALQGSWTALQSRGQDMVDILAALKIDAMVGHWEFTYGDARVKSLMEAAPFAFLAQNIREQEWQEPVFEASKLFERGGARIGVIGQAFPRQPIANPRWLVPKWEFGLREDDLQKEVDSLRAKGADLVVLLSHNGFDVDRKLASRVRGIDILLTAHTHDALPGIMRIGETALVASGSHGKFVSRLDVDIRDKRLVGLRYKLIPVFSEAIAPDPAMAEQIRKIRAPFAAELAREVGHSQSLLYRRGNFNGTFDDLLCQAMLAERDAEIALSPGFRWGGSLLPGEAITFEALTNATAITYPACYRLTMRGSQIKDVLEDVADNLFHPDPYFQGGGDMVRVGGLGYAIDIHQPIGSRISGLTDLKRNAPLEAGRDYVVSGWASVNETVQGPPIWRVVEDYLSSHKDVTIEPNNSVKIIDG